jgi:hypothetical protein
MFGEKNWIRNLKKLVCSVEIEKELTHVEDLETGDIKHTDEVLALLAGGEGQVTLDDEELEDAIEHGLGQGAHGVGALRFQNKAK